uniref:Uncharacterized protein n=1 Tax=uncultured marine thaumarchaeote AD1000_02_C08 TaxID=1455880 RepID=A0A075FKR8_9ARCH|nr:hypothetical protein [uncultured marine thaumarchaeote AD1000_02_C08]
MTPLDKLILDNRSCQVVKLNSTNVYNTTTQNLVKIYKTIMTWENDRLDAQAVLSMILTIHSYEGWEVHSIQHAGHKSDNPEIHRYIIVFQKDAKDGEGIYFILTEILKEKPKSFENKTDEEIIDYIYEQYDKKVDENYAEIDSINETNSEPDKS